MTCEHNTAERLRMKATNRTKTTVGICLLFTLLVSATSGLILHSGTHAESVRPGNFLRTLHLVSGLGMAALLLLHILIYARMLWAMREKFRWFCFDSLLLGALTGVLAVSGFALLAGLVGLPHLGLWHYYFGMAMVLAAIVHLFRGIPALRRKLSRSPSGRPQRPDQH